MTPAPRTGMPEVRLDRAEFERRYRERFRGPSFAGLEVALAEVTEAAWREYDASNKAPDTRKAGPEFHDPDHDLSVDWLRARDAVHAAEARHRDPSGPPRLLVVNGSPRSDHTCPGEMSKSWRMTERAREAMEAEGARVEVLDLSRTASEFGRAIHPCKGCFSTAAALCHWPCSCYPNHGLGQVGDWMEEIYPLWVEAHGIMIVTPVHWYQATSPLKAMIDRLVCADGGNPDPTLTHGKDAARAKAIELAGWPYPRHLSGRAFALAVHGDVEGAESVRRALSDWLRWMGLLPSGHLAEIDRYVGYWEPYATSHDALDADDKLMAEVEVAARSLARAAGLAREGRLPDPSDGLQQPRPK